MKVCYVLRSIPGAGKSTLANIIESQAQLTGHSSGICCADDYMMIDGEYKWSPEKVAGAHKQCREKFAALICINCENIIVANTNTTMKEMKFYIDLAKENEYFVQILTVGEFSDEAIERYTVQNTHGVPKETLVKMRDRFKLI